MASAPSQELHVVTGAFGFSGKYIARRLLDGGHLVRTLTNSIGRRNPFGDAIQVRPLDFEHEDKLAE
jgi:nucleoside-diphosphate-sugar epimerase